MLLTIRFLLLYMLSHTVYFNSLYSGLYNQLLRLFRFVRKKLLVLAFEHGYSQFSRTNKSSYESEYEYEIQV